MKTAEVIQRELRAFFTAEQVGWKPQTISGSRALAVAYIDARDVMDRLDAVVGAGGWQDEYEVLEGGNVVCTLRLLVEGDWLGKTDVGGESDQRDAGDKMKAAFSDALKRAAVKWGVGRYLYSLPLQWVDFDPQKKTFTRAPQLPDAFNPAKAPQAATPKAAAPAPAQPAPINDEAEARQLVPQIDAALRRAGKLWLAALRYAGVIRLKDDWPEPQDAVAAVEAVLGEMGRGAVTIYQLQRLAKELAPKGKKAPGAQPAA